MSALSLAENRWQIRHERPQFILAQHSLATTSFASRACGRQAFPLQSGGRGFESLDGRRIAYRYEASILALDVSGSQRTCTEVAFPGTGVRGHSEHMGNTFRTLGRRRAPSLQRLNELRERAEPLAIRKASELIYGDLHSLFSRV